MNFIVPYYKDAIQILAFAEKEMIIIWHALHLPSIREYLYSILHRMASASPVRPSRWLPVDLV